MRVTGVVKWFNDQKGYGWLAPDDGARDVFAHASAIQGDGYRKLTKGQRVSFEIVHGDKSPAASNITIHPAPTP